MTDLNRPRYSVMPLVVPAVSMFSSTASAHVKWFTPTNVRDAPKAIGAVLSPTFLAILILFAIMVLLGFMIDGIVARRFSAWTGSGFRNARTEQRLVRGAAGGYFVYVASYGTVLLAPELRDHAQWVAILQFVIAACLLWRRTCVISSAGILFLVGVSVYRYGVFHMTDYVFLPCLAIYLASISLPFPRLASLREPMLVGSLAFSLAWTAIEKFLYPQWTLAVLALHPAVGLGVPPHLVALIAGFVEFTLAFYLVTGRGLLRLGGFVYLAVFVAAMPAFGRLDVFGHLIIIATLLIVVLRGATPMQHRLHPDGFGVATDAAWITMLYLVSLTILIAAYYALQRTA